jgi:transcriptional regulator with XRE-family HTH domain
MQRKKNVPGYFAAFMLIERLLERMEAMGISKADLARRRKVKRSTVTRWFAPGRNLTVFTAAMIADSLGADLKIDVVPREPVAVGEGDRATVDARVQSAPTWADDVLTSTAPAAARPSWYPKVLEGRPTDGAVPTDCPLILVH